MIVLIIILITVQRDFGPMLISERQVRVYDRTDGGPNKGKTGEIDGDGDNGPKEDQPLLSFNMLLPVIILVVLVFVGLINTGTIPGEDQTFMDKIESSDSFKALLYSTMGTAWITTIFYLMQITIPGTAKLCWWTWPRFKKMVSRKKDTGVAGEEGDDEEPTPRFMMDLPECIESFLFGMARIFLAIIVLVRI